MLNSCYVCVLLVLLVLINLLNGRPQIVKPALHSSGTVVYNQTFVKKLKRSASKPADFVKTNKTKEEARILNFSGNKGGASFGQFSEQDIIFPDSFEVLFEANSRIDGPPKCADGGTFCENFDSYPYHHVKDILHNQVVDKSFFFGEDEIPIELEKRIGEDEETFLCSAISRIVFPKIGMNKNSEWKVIVNQGKDDGYVQGVRIETCRNQGGSCNIIGELPQGYRTSCKQKYVYRRLLSLSDGGTFIPDTFQLPSACCCSYTKDVQFLTRRAGTVSPSKRKQTFGD